METTFLARRRDKKKKSRAGEKNENENRWENNGCRQKKKDRRKEEKGNNIEAFSVTVPRTPLIVYSSPSIFVGGLRARLQRREKPQAQSVRTSSRFTLT